jgi:hypothetical protein
MAKAKNGSWVVRMTCTVDKEVIVRDCTAEEAELDPWAHAIHEREVSQTDWDVKSVEPND